MPSAKLDLGKYVVAQPPLSEPPRRDGTRRLLFQVPAKLRPSGWSAAIPLPISGDRTGDLTNADEMRRVREDAATLLTQLHGTRLEAPSEGAQTMPSLIRSWEASQHYKAKAAATQRGYSHYAKEVRAWSAAAKHPDVGKISYEKIEAFISLYDDRPTCRRHVKIVLKMLLDHAIKLKWMPGPNPLLGMKVAAPESTAVIWEQPDLDRVVKTCRREGAPAEWAVMAAMILTQWEIGQRPSDLILLRHGAEYRNETFRFWQAKTKSYVTIPVSKALGALLKEITVKDSLYLFVDPRTGRPFTGNEVSCTFRDIRGASLTKRKLTFRGLRHSCVVQLARAGCEIPEIASITGHSIQSVHQILQKYLPRDNVLAWSAQRKRGLITA